MKGEYLQRLNLACLVLVIPEYQYLAPAICRELEPAGIFPGEN